MPKARSNFLAIFSNSANLKVAVMTYKGFDGSYISQEVTDVAAIYSNRGLGQYEADIIEKKI